MQEFSEEQLAVLQVINADFDSYLARDKKRWAEQWVADERFHSIMECGPLQIAHGFDAFRDNVFQAMDAEPNAFDVEYTRDNIRIFVLGDFAWAVFEEMISEINNPFAPPILTHNVRVLLRENENWRIVFHGCWDVKQRDAKTPTIEVDKDCKVIWMNQSAHSSMKEFGGLCVSHGHLRASNANFSSELREKVDRAHRLTGFTAYNIAASEGGGSVTLHVDLGEDDDGQPLLCWTRVADGRVFVLFDASPNFDNQIAIAQIMYGLSDTQTKAVRMIAEGMDLLEIADAQGVSVNTVKTHIKRAYEKLDVSSQVELLRKLVSLGV